MSEKENAIVPEEEYRNMLTQQVEIIGQVQQLEQTKDALRQKVLKLEGGLEMLREKFDFDFEKINKELIK